ncbi:MAG: dephospho-CoA kinase [Bacteroidales bacterium]|nr:dephospho-CoA kinase [Bacteroidales bacterium]
MLQQNYNQFAISEIKKLFGNDIYINNQLDRKTVSNLVFSNPDLLKKLNEIIHPLVKSSFDVFVENNKNKDFIIIESAILVQSGFYKFTDFNVLVTAPLNIRLERVAKRDNLSIDAIKARISNQLDDSENQKFCNYSIINDNKHSVIEQVKEIINNYCQVN